MVQRFKVSRNKEGTLTACVELPWLSARILMPGGDYEYYVAGVRVQGVRAQSDER